jgi:class 3 adenylate cyclase
VQSSKINPKPEDTAIVKYVFVDVVDFTKNRSIEAQSYVVGYLNGTIKAALATVGVDLGRTILIPTGDGVAIALLNAGPYDLHVQIALQILRDVGDQTSQTEDSMRKFNVRIGINQNEDNLISDINGNTNVAGWGISLAQRIMGKADGGQILVGRSVYETLNKREHYMRKFREYQTTDKHGEKISVYQFCPDGVPGLNTDTPSAFADRKLTRPKLTRDVAYYIAHAAQHREFLLSRKEAYRDYAALVLLYFLAHDSASKSETPEHEEPYLITWNPGESSFEQQYQHYLGVDGTCLQELAKFIEADLEPYEDLFASDSHIFNFAFVRDTAIVRLWEDWPKIALEFKLQKPDSKGPSATKS